MTNSFSRDYKPAALSEEAIALDRKARKISENRSRQRREGMASDDPKVRKIALGTLPGGPLSKRGVKGFKA